MRKEVDIMKTMIFFDTNFIKGAKPNKDFMNILIKNSIVPYTSDFIIYELKGQRVRYYKTIYDQLNEKIASCKDLYSQLEKNSDDLKPSFKIELNINMDNLYKKMDKTVDGWIQELFGDKIIKKDDNSYLMQVLFERNRYKLTPFVSLESDKGWLDTLIWTNFLDFCKKETFDKYVFVTMDGGFTKKSIELKREFEETTKKTTLEIMDFKTCQAILTYFQLDTVQDTSMAEEKLQEAETAKVDESDNQIISVAQYVVKNLTTTEVHNYYESHVDYNFYFRTRFNLETGKKLCNVMEESIDDYLFFSEIDLSEISSKIGIEADVFHFISNETYLSVVRIWRLIKNKMPLLVYPFLKYLVDSLNRMEVRSIDI